MRETCFYCHNSLDNNPPIIKAGVAWFHPQCFKAYPWRAHQILSRLLDARNK